MEPRRRGPRPLDWRKELGLDRPLVRETIQRKRVRDIVFSAVFSPKGFKVFSIMTLALALLLRSD